MSGIYVIFDGPPSHDSGRFVEVEDGEGHGLGTEQTGADWERYGEDLWRLGPFAPSNSKLVEALGWALEAIARLVPPAATSEMEDWELARYADSLAEAARALEEAKQ